MNLTLLGASGEVTGSSYLARTRRASVLVDFGLFQGSTQITNGNVVPAALKVEDLDAVVITHAHLDHTGRLPLLARRGYKRPIYATPASIEFTKLILEDAQEEALRLDPAALAPNSVP